VLLSRRVCVIRRVLCVPFEPRGRPVAFVWNAEKSGRIIIIGLITAAALIVVAVDATKSCRRSSIGPESDASGSYPRRALLRYGIVVIRFFF